MRSQEQQQQQQTSQQMQDASQSFAAAAAAAVVQQSSTAGRSVVDYATADDVRHALEERMDAATGPCADPPPGKSDWLLPVADPHADQQTVQNEMQRLLTLKSYLLLDAAKEEAFDRLTREACDLFGVPTSLISLVDLGRQFLLAGTADGEVRETSRTAAFCSHTILSKTGICVVPDTKEDPRFQKNDLVTQGPKLRFYAGAPLISPEGYKLGTFCVEGPDPRPEGLSQVEQSKLKEFARKAMDLMVERRTVMQRAYEAANLPENAHLRKHAAVTTNLGSLVFKHYVTESVIAMSLFQESVQTLMHVEEEGAAASSQNNQLPSKDRQAQMSQLFDTMNAPSSNAEELDALIRELHILFPDAAAPQLSRSGNSFTTNGIPGLFSTASKLKGALPMMQALFFNEAFEVCMTPSKAFDPKDPHSNLDDRSFIIPLDQCSKATLFNMGLIHYYWGSADSAMQFFDLAASLSHAQDATDFDPVVLACLNNMAQIHLQYGRSGDAMELLSDALTRGNAALTTIYGSSCGSDEGGGAIPPTTTPAASSSDNNDPPPNSKMLQAQREHDIRRTRRLRRKLSRTVLNIGHVHFFKCEYDAAMGTCDDALKLLHTDINEIEVAAVWYNLALLHYHKGNKTVALKNVEKFLSHAKKTLQDGPHSQIADALQRRGKIMFEMGQLYACMTPLNEALKMRISLFGKNQQIVAETLCLIGKVLQEREEYDFALNALEQGLLIQRNQLAVDGPNGGDEQMLSFEVAQTLLEIGRANHALGKFPKALGVYNEVLILTKQFFGDRHPFVARICNILGNLYLETGDTVTGVERFEEAMQIQLEQGISVDMAIVQDPLLKVDMVHHPAAKGA